MSDEALKLIRLDLDKPDRAGRDGRVDDPADEFSELSRGAARLGFSR